ncbi:MAG: hypothetical protein K5860_06595 [Bacteroidales bacterium]|nr:hypothetical protein [Bacteroidales bacterium]
MNETETIIERLRDDIRDNYDALLTIYQTNGESYLQPSAESMSILIHKNPAAYEAAIALLYPEEYAQSKNIASADGEFWQKLGAGWKTFAGNFTGRTQQVANEEALESISASNAAIEEQAGKYQTYSILVLVICLALVAVLVFVK